MKINRLDEIFLEKDVKNRVIASYFNKSESTISLWRNNKRQPSLEEFREIAKLLRMNVKDLFYPTSWLNEPSETYQEYALKLKQKDKEVKEQLATIMVENDSFIDFLGSGKDINKIAEELIRLKIVDTKHDIKSIAGAMRLLIKDEKIKYITESEGKKLYVFGSGEDSNETEVEKEE